MLLDISEFAMALQYVYEDEMDNTKTERELKNLVYSILDKRFTSFKKDIQEQIANEVVGLYKPE